MGPLIAAWLVGEGIIIYRSVKKQHAPPGPGQLILSSGVFILLALMAESARARPLAITLAWGFDIAAYMNIAGTKFGGEAKASGAKWPPGKASSEEIYPSGKS